MNTVDRLGPEEITLTPDFSACGIALALEESEPTDGLPRQELPVKSRLRVEITSIPTATFDRLQDEALDALADALAERFIAKARARVASKLGVHPDDIDREHGREMERAAAVFGGAC